MSAEPLSKTRERNLRHGFKVWREQPQAGEMANVFATIDLERGLKEDLLEALEKLRDAGQEFAKPYPVSEQFLDAMGAAREAIEKARKA